MTLLIAIRDLTESVRMTYPNGWIELVMGRTGELSVVIRNGAVVQHRGCILPTMGDNDSIIHLVKLRESMTLVGNDLFDKQQGGS